MMTQHVSMMFGTEAFQDRGLGLVMVLVGTLPAAPVFMFIMGFMFIHRGKDDLRTNLMVPRRSSTARGFGAT